MGHPATATPDGRASGLGRAPAWRRVCAYAADLALVLVHVPLLAIHLGLLWKREGGWLWPLLILAVIGLVWDRQPQERPTFCLLTRVLASTFLFSALALLAVATALFSPRLGAAAAILAAGSLLIGAAGDRFWRDLLPAWALCWLLVPPWEIVQNSVCGWLTRQVARWASALLDQMGYLHVLAGDVIEFPGWEVSLQACCGGIRCLVPLMALVAAYVVWARRGWLHSLLVLASVIAWACFADLAGVLVCSTAAGTSGANWADGEMGPLVRAGAFALAVVLAASTDQLIGPLANAATFQLHSLAGLLGRLLTPRRQSPLTGAGVGAGPGGPVAAGTTVSATGDRMEDSPGGNKSRQREEAWGFWTNAACLAIGGGLALLQLPVLPPLNAFPGERRSTCGLCAISERFFPEKLMGWSKRSFHSAARPPGSDEGEHSRTWRYESGAGSATVGVDFPFAGWRDVTGCYGRQAWSVRYQGITELPSGRGGERIACVEVGLCGPSGEFGLLLYGLFTAEGRPLDPPTARPSWAQRLQSAWESAPLRAWWSGRLSARGGGQGILCRLRLLIHSDAPLSSRARKNALDAYRVLSRELGRQLRGS